MNRIYLFLAIFLYSHCSTLATETDRIYDFSLDEMISAFNLSNLRPSPLAFRYVPEAYEAVIKGQNFRLNYVLFYTSSNDPVLLGAFYKSHPPKKEIKNTLGFNSILFQYRKKLDNGGSEYYSVALRLVNSLLKDDDKIPFDLKDVMNAFPELKSLVNNAVNYCSSADKHLYTRDIPELNPLVDKAVNYDSSADKHLCTKNIKAKNVQLRFCEYNRCRDNLSLKEFIKVNGIGSLRGRKALSENIDNKPVYYFSSHRTHHIDEKENFFIISYSYID